MNRSGWFALALLGAVSACAENTRPNFVLMMCDDLGYGDVGFNGNDTVLTPHLDKLATDGVNLTHFYSIGPVCSPTRTSFVTGRHYWRMGIWSANKGHLPKEEFTLAKMLKQKGYTTGHFGKWHMGTLNPETSPKGKGRMPKKNFAPPWERDYDRSFVMEVAVKTWEPTEGRQAKDNPYYENGKVTTENLNGDTSRIIMDRAIPFIQEAAKSDTPFLSVIWFNAPHKDVEAGPEHLARYEGFGEAAHYLGCISGVDDQVGRLREELERLGIADDTVLLFTSDNGPVGNKVKTREEYMKQKGRVAGSSGGFTGGKRTIHEGGVRVPGLAYWPGVTQPGSVIDVPMSVLDYLPTIGSYVGAKLPEDRIRDGENILPILKGEKKVHDKSIPFRHHKQAWLVKGKYKLIIESADDTSNDLLFDLTTDKTEANNVASRYPEKVVEMRKEILAFLASAEKSHAGEEYNTDFQPVETWVPLGIDYQERKKSGKTKAK
ncbi:sulfatase family protein [Pontiella sulfatireligans]|uniref:Arylsulfatase n=1 Tax=Pontiella sulfatireligans TaxID=2750658 RepID=A0A6C2UFC7_9BACT|nr:sulfatase-like hydrolase/transferase [Pontiella sulfatireligans]SPS74130.1 sulfatase S1_23 [Kiritimatiellales bacterium]VGO18084.1 Arylsulfatase [Pontiella sulfatireligans]